MEFNETWQVARSQCPLPSLCFSGRSEKQDGRPGLWLAETFSTSPLKLLNGIQRNLTGSKISTSSTKFVFFGPIGKTRWPPWPLIGWDIFDFFSETAERNSTKLDRKQDLNVLYQVCVFRADRKNKMAALASDWLRHFRLLLWNRWTEFNETWQEARSQCPLPSLCFSGQLKKKDGHPGQSAKKVAHCTQVHDMWPFGPLVFFFLRPMSIVSYQFCPVPTCAHHVFCTLFSCLSIDSSLYHVIFSHVTVFSVFFVKGKVEFVTLSSNLITYILINCEWFIIKLCGIGIILLTDLLCGITSYYFSIDLRYDCIFNIVT